MWDATAFALQGTAFKKKNKKNPTFGHTYAQVEKGKFVQVQSTYVFILLAARRVATLRPSG